MPYIRFTGFETSLLQKIAVTLVDRFAAIVNIPHEIIKIEKTAIEPILNSPQSVEIQMFQRDQQTHDAIALMIHTLLQEHGCPSAHIYYNLLSPALYYKGGVPLNQIPKKSSAVHS
ncbi:DUF1904 family protein [Tumebacillus flagellatus]|uniref:DUF1904 domain-containing protein n=1 Tax=Tumebacillus flagellatus TaxID=1157490 RepID=A0A074MGL1_9BACL|nr:DUF1904 family protein [Tumebacillus flagellatus]KEO84857.1 hypothetical protein EL26_02280 [Tumebacillus flagellatus]